MKVIVEIKDKKGGIVSILSCDPSMKEEVMSLCAEGYPDSFDEYDIAEIKKSLEGNVPCIVARRKNKLVGMVQFSQWPAIQAGWVLPYIYTREKGLGIGEMLCSAVEESLKKEARILFSAHTGALPKSVSSYGFFPKIGYKEWGVLPGYFRDDLWGIFFIKRNPYYPIGKGIPRNSGWCKEMIDERSGRHLSREEYRLLKNGLEMTPKEKWGFNLFKRSIIKSHA